MQADSCLHSFLPIPKCQCTYPRSDPLTACPVGSDYGHELDNEREERNEELPSEMSRLPLHVHWMFYRVSRQSHTTQRGDYRRSVCRSSKGNGSLVGLRPMEETLKDLPESPAGRPPHLPA